MSGESQDLIFADMSQPVRLLGCDELLPHLPLVFPGWNIESIVGGHSTPILELSSTGDNYRLEGYWLTEPLIRDDTVDALCALVAEVMRAYVRQDDRMLCLHGAAAEFGGRLVVFPSKYRSGKSVLSACLAAAGGRLFCDDILPLGLQQALAIAPGLALRLRLPLPQNLSPDSRRFIESHTRLRGKHYAYLELDDDTLARRGQQLPIGAFVLLERQAGVAAELEVISEADVLAQVVWQNFAREAEAPVILAVLSRLVATARRFRLRYDRAEDAVAVLQREFAEWPDALPAVADPQADSSEQAVAAGTLVARQYRQKPGISMVEVDDQSFLADRQGAAIHHLNPIGSSIWGLLEQPVTLDEIVEVLLTAFPDLDPARVRADVGSLLQELMRKDLLQYGGD